MHVRKFICVNAVYNHVKEGRYLNIFKYLIIKINIKK